MSNPLTILTRTSSAPAATVRETAAGTPATFAATVEDAVRRHEQMAGTTSDDASTPVDTSAPEDGAAAAAAASGTQADGTDADTAVTPDPDGVTGGEAGDVEAHDVADLVAALATGPDPTPAPPAAAPTARQAAADAAADPDGAPDPATVLARGRHGIVTGDGNRQAVPAAARDGDAAPSTAGPLTPSAPVSDGAADAAADASAPTAPGNSSGDVRPTTPTPTASRPVDTDAPTEQRPAAGSSTGAVTGGAPTGPVTGSAAPDRPAPLTERSGETVPVSTAPRGPGSSGSADAAPTSPASERAAGTDPATKLPGRPAPVSDPVEAVPDRAGRAHASDPSTEPDTASPLQATSATPAAATTGAQPAVTAAARGRAPQVLVSRFIEQLPETRPATVTVNLSDLGLGAVKVSITGNVVSVQGVPPHWHGQLVDALADHGMVLDSDQASGGDGQDADRARTDALAQILAGHGAVSPSTHRRALAQYRRAAVEV